MERPLSVIQRGSLTPEVRNKEDERDPHVVFTQTAKGLALFFKDVLADPRLLQNYLQDYTLPLLYGALDALPLVKRPELQGGIIPPELLHRKPEGNLPDEAFEALDIAAIAFSEIPNQYHARPFGAEASLTGMMSPPLTVNGIFSRLSEVIDVTSDIANGKLRSNTLPIFSIPLIRTNAFYETIKDPAIYHNPSNGNKDLRDKIETFKAYQKEAEYRFVRNLLNTVSFPDE